MNKAFSADNIFLLKNSNTKIFKLKKGKLQNKFKIFFLKKCPIINSFLFSQSHFLWRPIVLAIKLTNLSYIISLNSKN